MDEFDFTEDEIKEQLEILGYSNVPKERLIDFKRDLEHLVKHERSKNSSIFSTSEQSSSSDSEAQRVRHYHHLNGIGRPHLDEPSHRPTTSGITSTSSVEHSKYGKENIFIAPPGQPYEIGKFSKIDKTAEAVRSTQESGTDYSLYTSEDDPQLIVPGERGAHDDTLDTTGSERRVMKRKVLRKRDGHAEIYETESESGDMDSLQERLRNLPLSLHMDRPSTAPGYRPRGRATEFDMRPHSARDPAPSYRLPDDFEGPKALIRPMTGDPNLKNIKKSDPVSRGLQYRNSWHAQRAPGEKLHKGLRWGVREQMLYHDQVIDKKQHKVFVPNKFRVPSDKKRKNLRWQIRADLAQGVVPPSVFD